MAIDPLQMLNDALARLVPIVQSVLNPIATFNKALGELQKSLASLVDSAIKAATASVKAFGDVLGAILSPLAGLGDAFLDFAGTAIGKAIAGIKAVASAFASAFSGGALGAVADYLGGIIESVVAAFAAVGGVLFDVAAACGDVVMAFVGVAAAVVAIGAGILAMGEAMSIFVGKANPALVQVFTNAVDDLMAVIGMGLAPVFKVVTALVRLMADSLMTWVPQLGEVVGIMAAALLPAFRMMGDALGRMGQVFTKVIETVMPGVIALVEAFVGILDALTEPLTQVIGLMGGIMVELYGAYTKAVLWATPYLMAFAHVITDLVKIVVDGIKQLMAIMGIDFDVATRATDRDASVGAAAKGTSIGDIDSVIKKAQQSAFSLGTGASDPPTRSAAASEAIKARADEIYAYLQTIPDEIQTFFDAGIERTPAKLWDAFAKLPVIAAIAKWLNDHSGEETGRDVAEGVESFTGIGSALNWLFGAPTPRGS